MGSLSPSSITLRSRTDESKPYRSIHESSPEKMDCT